MKWIHRGFVLLFFGLCALLPGGCSGEATSAATDNNNSTDKADATYKPTTPQLTEVGTQLIGPHIYTVDARSKEVWMYFDFSRASVVAVQDPKTDDWDLAFRRHAIRSNGGATNAAGQAALLSLSGQNFEAVKQVPADADFKPDARTTQRPFAFNPVLDRWYNYSYLSNVLVPKPFVYLLRTQDGKYAKLRILSYYCDGNISGCITFEYVYQGNGSLQLAPAAQG